MTQAAFHQLLHQIGPSHLIGFFLVLARLTPLFVLAPLFSSPMVPAQVRAVIAIALSLGLTGIAMHGHPVPTDALSIAGLFICNALIGLGFALAVAAVFAAVTSAGALLDVISGFSYGQLINPFDGSQGGTLTNLYSLVGLALFIAIGGDAWLLRGIAGTFNVVPLTGAPDITTLTGGVLSAVDTLFVGALEVAAPAMLALLVTDVAFGMVSRVVPQLNVFAVGFPVKVGVALLIVAAALPFLGGFMSDQISSGVSAIVQAV